MKRVNWKEYYKAMADFYSTCRVNLRITYVDVFVKGKKQLISKSLAAKRNLEAISSKRKYITIYRF